MTKEEAIERLEWYQCHAETKEDADAFDMAISALRPDAIAEWLQSKPENDK